MGLDTYRSQRQFHSITHTHTHTNSARSGNNISLTAWEDEEDAGYVGGEVATALHYNEVDIMKIEYATYKIPMGMQMDLCA